MPAVEVISNALERGCNYFDTAEAYDNGASEKTLGDVLKQVEKRDQAVIGILPYDPRKLISQEPRSCLGIVLQRSCENTFRRVWRGFRLVLLLQSTDS